MKQTRFALLLALMATVIGATAGAVLVRLPAPDTRGVLFRNDPAPEPDASRNGEPKSFIATVVRDRVDARSAPRRSARVVASFGRRSPQGGPQVFLLQSAGRSPRVRGRPGIWYKALLPVRPNGTTGYLPANAVRLSATPYRLVVDRTSFRLTLFQGDEAIESFPVGIGTGETPTPVGSFYLASLLEPPNQHGVYGTYAYGLSGYSDVITDWKGGGIVGLHGTNDPSSVGRRVSHGCMRMRNRDIQKLVRLLPLGTPIEIE